MLAADRAPLPTSSSAWCSSRVIPALRRASNDGVLFGAIIEIQRLIVHLATSIMMRIVGRLAQLDDPILFLGRVIVTTARGILG